MKYIKPTAVAYPVLLASVVIIMGCGGPSSAELKSAEDQCVSFYKRERATYSDYVKAVDHWMKDGKLVIELAKMKSEYSKTYQQGLCIYDEKRGSLVIPGVFEHSRWEK